MKLYRLHKARKILRQSHALFIRKKRRLRDVEADEIERAMKELDAACLSKERHRASEAAHKVEELMKLWAPKTALDMTRELIVALVFAVVVAFAIRELWFELYEVPTGSMRPTIEEKDRLLVSKTTFGLHLPFSSKLLLFKPEYLRRNGIIVLTTENMDVLDRRMLYFGFLPGMKRYIKRNVAKPGDTLYFYGGRIYGVDKEGKPITELFDEKYLEEIGISKIDHVPFITFQGKLVMKNKVSHGLYNNVEVRQMNLPVARLNVEVGGRISGTFFDGKHWEKENFRQMKMPHAKPAGYSDLWGIGNYAMVRLLTADEVAHYYQQKIDPSVPLYLEINHHPTLSIPKPEIRRLENGKFGPIFTPFSSLMPLKQEHLDTLMQNLYTARFFIKNGQAYRYQEGNKRGQPLDFDPKFPGVPDGCYEFYYGQGYAVHFGGIRTKLADDHPLYAHTPENVQKLFNVGIAFNRLFEPQGKLQPYNPQRFAYYRDGDLYVMGALLMGKDDPTLIAFVKQELERQDKNQYLAFVDKGPPLMEGGFVDTEFIKAFGLRVPDNAVVGLGDNYAMSADSRDFGFIPTQNLRGSPSFTFWPPSSRIGLFPQNRYAWVTLPNFLSWGTVTVISILYLIYLGRRNNRSIFK